MVIELVSAPVAAATVLGELLDVGVAELTVEVEIVLFELLVCETGETLNTDDWI